MRVNRRPVCAATMFAILVTSQAAFGGENERTPLGKVAGRVLEEFEHIDSLASAHLYLEKARPDCIPPALKARLIARLPRAGDVGPNARGRLKLSAIDPVLEYHGRKAAIEVKVVHAIQAFVGLHARSLLLISEWALELLSPEELQAIAAHEIGHEYFWGEYRSAAGLRDPGKLQEVELRCDAVAVLTLLCLGLNPAALLSGVSKQGGFNELVGATANANCYVSIKERTRFVRALTDRVMREPGQFARR